MNVKKTKSSKKIVLKIAMSMTSCHESIRVQQDRVELDPSLVIRRRTRRIARLLLHLESCQICGKSNNVGHSLHDPE